MTGCRPAGRHRRSGSPEPTGGGDRGSRASLDPGSRAALGRGHGAREATSDRGSFTAELAAGLPALVLLLLVGLTAVNAVTTRGGCLDAAREAALAAARGENGTTVGARYAPPGADVAVTVAGDRVTATVHVPVRTLGARLPRLTVSATAVAAVEPGAPAPRP